MPCDLHAPRSPDFVLERRPERLGERERVPRQHRRPLRRSREIPRLDRVAARLPQKHRVRRKEETRRFQEHLLVDIEIRETCEQRHISGEHRLH
ncbi:hypothetical protein L596_003462 [Steinernema carpocapsae]|uniref:Uncharacterized protein n=1 Tax=Steinernema carpocapsae TaxID=34508 RepID=A0A4V6I803_STECR|nr:hypothetical protein L596_003462 [Steinernema carpocapsae]